MLAAITSGNPSLRTFARASCVNASANAAALRAPIELVGRGGLRAGISADSGTFTVRARVPGRLGPPARSSELAAGLAEVHPNAFLISRGFPLGPCTGDIVAYTLLILILLVRPEGLLGTGRTRPD